MNRTILVCAMLAVFAGVAGAQQTSQQDPYTGVSTPPPNSTIVDSAPAPPPKPPAAHPMPAQPPAAQYPQTAPAAQPVTPAQGPQPAYANPAPEYAPPATANGDGTDNGIVQVEQPGGETPSDNPKLLARLYASDPDGDIVHPQPLPPGELGQGTVIRVELLDQLSTAINQRGDTFRSRVASDVLQDGTVLIPAGSEIDGQVMQASSGHFGGSGSMDLRPESVTLPDGTRYQMYAMVSGTPDSRTRVGAEGTITPGSQLRHDSILYGGGVGAGAAVGAVLGGPVGALAGTLIGATAITAHLLVSHPQATLDPGTTLLFTLTEPLDLVPAAPRRN
jgi:hypothetical protein